MNRIQWDVEEAVALMQLYFDGGSKIPVSPELVDDLSQKLKLRAQLLGIEYDEKFRNTNGLNMQLACVHYVVTDGKEGLSGASKLFFDTYQMYSENEEKFKSIYKNFKAKVGC